MTGEPLPGRGEVWWVRVDKRRPAIVVQSDTVREPRVRSFLIVPLTSRLHLAELTTDEISSICEKALRADFLERAGALSAESLARLDAGLPLVLHL